jgi:glycerol-3-phosphate dehydrogenase
VSARRENELWTVWTQNSNGTKQSYRAKVLINAAGPWVDRVLHEGVGQKPTARIRLVRGSHIVVPRIFDHDRCYIFQNTDGRIIFAIPYEEDFTLIGTTDCDHGDDPGKVKISDEEIAYLCESANTYFRKATAPVDVVWTYSAVRPLLDDGKTEAKAATRDYYLQTEARNGQPPLINIFGGKITTYRKLSEEVMEKAERYLPPCGQPWTATASLPGGDFPVDGYTQQVSDLSNSYPFLSDRHARRLVRLYGTLAHEILGNARSYDDLGRCFGSDLFEAEILYQVEKEWVVRAEDVLWRRTKEGLRVSQKEAEELDRYLMKPGLNERIFGGDTVH